MRDLTFQTTSILLPFQVYNKDFRDLEPPFPHTLCVLDLIFGATVGMILEWGSFNFHYHPTLLDEANDSTYLT
jgi:hypothetical protein